MSANPEQIANYHRIKSLGGEPSPPEEQPYGIEIHTADGVFIKQMHIPKKGALVPQHEHHWDHTSLLARGSVLVWKDGVLCGREEAPTGIFIKAGVRHAFQSLEDDTVIYCIHGVHSPQAQALLRSHGLDSEDL